MAATLCAMFFAACDPVDTLGGEVKSFGAPPGVIGGERPARVIVPDDYDPAKTYPLVVELHGFGASSILNDVIFGLGRQTTEKQFILVLPEGTKNKSGKQFWSADDYCCDFDDQGVDDVTYLKGLLAEAQDKMNVDAARISFVGHSNGGYMTYRMGCEVPELFTRMVVLAGAMPWTEDDCPRPAPLDVVHIHGTADEIVPYADSMTLPAEIDPENIRVRSPGAEGSLAAWAKVNGCDASLTPVETADFLTDQDGAETEVLAHASCGSGKETRLWRMNGGDHVLLDRAQAFQEAIAAFVVK